MLLYNSRRKQGKQHREIVKYLVLRGLLLVMLEWTLVALSWGFVVFLNIGMIFPSEGDARSLHLYAARSNGDNHVPTESFESLQTFIFQMVLACLGMVMVILSLYLPLYWSLSFGRLRPALLLARLGICFGNSFETVGEAQMSESDRNSDNQNRPMSERDRNSDNQNRPMSERVSGNRESFAEKVVAEYENSLKGGDAGDEEQAGVDDDGSVNLEMYQVTELYSERDIRASGGCSGTTCSGAILSLFIAFTLYSLTSVVLVHIPVEGNPFSNNLFAAVWFFPDFSHKIYGVLYPLTNWIAVGLLGLVFGQTILLKEQRTHAWAGLFFVSLLAVAAAPVMRTWGWYFTLEQKDAAFWRESIYCFMSVVKYPPSLVFICFNLGVVGMFMSSAALLRFEEYVFCYPLSVLGKASLFFYIVHIWVYGVIGFFIYNTTLLGAYILWVLGLIPLFYLCKYYGDFKHRQPADSLWRFF